MILLVACMFVSDLQLCGYKGFTIMIRISALGAY